MGPLFSAAIAVIVFTVVVVATFAVFCLFCLPGKAFTYALAFAFGAALGVGLAAVLAIPIIGIGKTLNSTSAVVAYLGSLCVTGFVCGSFSVRLVSSVLTRHSSRPSTAAELKR